ncbi:MAG: ATP-binding cassette domain-containing protein [Cellvibrionaceae bacterium]
MIEINSLHKKFGKIVAVENVSFSIKSSEIVGLLGPNGAGKTTTMRIVSGLVKQTSGEVTIGGVDVASQPQVVQRLLGVMPDGGGLYARLTARENIRYFGELHGVTKNKLNERINYLINLLHMHDIIDRRVDGFSHGEKTKVALARAIIHDPDYILLDEPTNGLDVLTTRAVRGLLLALKEQGKVIVFSSHLMHEVDHLCDRAIVVAKGRVIASGTLPELKSQTNTETFEDAFVQLAYDKDEVVGVAG